MKSVSVEQNSISIINKNGLDYISLTDMTSNFEGGSALIENWLRNKDTVEFLGIWEEINNSDDFNSPEFEGIKNLAGTNRFYLSAKKWIEATNAIGIISKSGRYGGTFAHKDIAFHFGLWLSPKFQLLLIKEFQRLKDEENERLNQNWNLHRTLSKINYRIHTDSIKENLIPKKLSKLEINFVYASEADLLNKALFGKTAKEWKNENTDLAGNIRDYSSIEQLLVLANLEILNSEFIRDKLTQPERLEKLNSIAIKQLNSLATYNSVNKLKGE